MSAALGPGVVDRLLGSVARLAVPLLALAAGYALGRDGADDGSYRRGERSGVQRGLRIGYAHGYLDLAARRKVDPIWFPSDEAWERAKAARVDP